MLSKYYEQEKIEKINKIIIFVLLAMLCIVPIITFKYISNSYSPVFMNNLYTTGVKIDVFNFYKSIVLYLGTGIIFTLFMYKIVVLKDEIRESKLNILMLILALGIIISPLVSSYKDIALMGNFDRHEGAIAWFCYLIILFVLYNTKIDEKYFKTFYFALVPFLIINVVLSVSKTFGNDLINNSIVQTLIGGNGELEGQFFTTLYHYNFASGVAAVIFSSSYMYMLLEKDVKKKSSILIVASLSFAMLLAMISNGGFITIVILIPIIITLACRLADKKSVITWSAILLVINAIIYFILNNQNANVYEESVALFAKLNSISVLIIPTIIALFVAILLIMKFVNKKKFFNISLSIMVVGTLMCVSLYALNLNNQNKVLEQNPNASIVRIQDTSIYNKLNEISTDRLNIWTKTLDLINDKPLFGYGFDTFPYVFISNDDNGGLSTYGEIIDKPHNWYLSVTYGSGLIGLIGLIGVIIYIMKGVFDNVVDKIDDKYIYVFGIGSIAYAVQGMFNDSLVGTSIIFWIFAGLSLNLLKNEINE